MREQRSGISNENLQELLDAEENPGNLLMTGAARQASGWRPRASLQSTSSDVLFTMSVSIDRMIAKLQEAKAAGLSGDTELRFWDGDRQFRLTDSHSFDGPIEGKIAADRSYVGFEVDQIEPL